MVEEGLKTTTRWLLWCNFPRKFLQGKQGFGLTWTSRCYSSLSLRDFLCQEAMAEVSRGVWCDGLINSFHPVLHLRLLWWHQPRHSLHPSPASIMQMVPIPHEWQIVFQKWGWAKWENEKWAGRLRCESQSALKWFNLSDEELTVISLHFDNERHGRFRGPVTKMWHTWQTKLSPTWLTVTVRLNWGWSSLSVRPLSAAVDLK